MKQRYYPMRGFGNFESASRFCAAFEEMQQYFRGRRRGEPHVPLAEQRRLFLTRWRSLISEVAAAGSRDLRAVDALSLDRAPAARRSFS